MKSRECIQLLIVASMIAPPVLGQTTFSKVSTGDIVNDGGHSFGCAWGDYDDDGFIDLFVANGFGERIFLYRNQGDGSFARVHDGPIGTDIVDASAGVWADYDNDGHLDLFVTNYEEPVEDFVYRNNGDTTFSRILDGDWVNDEGRGVQAAWGDYDCDGYVDLVVVNPGSSDFQYHNNGDGTMEKVVLGPIPEDAAFTGSIVWSDYDGDQDLDLWQGGKDNCALFQNLGTGEFALMDGPGEGGIYAGAAYGDLNNDGFMDLFAPRGGSIGAESNFLFINSGTGAFEQVTEGDIVSTLDNSIGSAWGDYDNDGYLDVFVSNALGQDDMLFHNEGDGSFMWVDGRTIETLGANSWGCAWGDYDNDGDLDLFVSQGGTETPATPQENNLLYRNSGSPNSWLHVRLVGTLSNRSGVGAKVRVRTSVDGQQMWQLREISGGSGYCSQNDLRAHFGLGSATQVDLLRIEWPSGIVQELKDVTPEQTVTVAEPPRLILMGDGGFEIQCWIHQSFEIQTSTDLRTWSLSDIITNETGTLIHQFEDTGSRDCHYYRAVSR